MKLQSSSSGFITVRILPSLHDVGQTEGLCQMLDGQKERNLTQRDGTPSPCPENYKTNITGLESFLTSWR